MSLVSIHKAQPAFDVLERLGGKRNVAASLDVHPSTLSRWCQPSPHGTGGTIPQRHWGALLALAARQSVPLTLSDLAGIR